MTKIKTAIYGGSFNPIHKGHLGLGKYLISSDLVEEVWFVVSPLNPLKDSKSLTDEKIRLISVTEVLKHHKGLEVCDIEFNLPYPSYTATTLKALSKKYPSREFVLLIGSDNLKIFNKWYEYKFIIENFDIYVYPRAGYSCEIPKELYAEKVNDNEEKKQAHKIIILKNAPLYNISSTQIRKGEIKNEIINKNTK